MKVLVTGATGFVGRHIVERLMADGHQVTGLSRSASGPDQVSGDVTTGEGLAGAVAGVDAVIHLVGIIRERGRPEVQRRACARHAERADRD